MNGLHFEQKEEEKPNFEGSERGLTSQQLPSAKCMTLSHKALARATDQGAGGCPNWPGQGWGEPLSQKLWMNEFMNTTWFC